MEKINIEKIIITSENETEKCYYEVNKNKDFFKRETKTFNDHPKAGTINFNVNYFFESNVSESMWNYIMHYNNALISQINNEIPEVKKKNPFTIQLDLSNGQSLKNVVYGKIVGSSEIGLFSCVIFFPSEINKPFWAK